MQAFKNDPMVKEALINQLQAHYDADEIIKGVYWEDGKGCAIGCAIHSNDHGLYEKRFAIPRWLARVQDRIFEGLPNDKAKEWPILFTKAVNLGSDLEKIKIPFLIFIVESVLDKFDHDKFPKIKESIDSILSLLGESFLDKERLISEAYAAADAAYAANAAAYAANAAYAAYAAADAAANAAYAAANAAYAADAAANAADAAANAANVAYTDAYIKFSEKLIELISGCH